MYMQGYLAQVKHLAVIAVVLPGPELESLLCKCLEIPTLLALQKRAYSIPKFRKTFLSICDVLDSTASGG